MHRWEIGSATHMGNVTLQIMGEVPPTPPPPENHSNCASPQKWHESSPQPGADAKQQIENLRLSWATLGLLCEKAGDYLDSVVSSWVCCGYSASTGARQALTSKSLTASLRISRVAQLDPSDLPVQDFLPHTRPRTEWQTCTCSAKLQTNAAARGT